MSTTTAAEIEHQIRQELTQLAGEQVSDLARVIERLIDALEPERIHAFGSQTRGDADSDSDIDLMIVVRESDDPSYRRAQQAYFAIGRHRVPVEVLVWTTAEFEERQDNPASLAATILREGRLLYAA